MFFHCHVLDNSCPLLIHFLYLDCNLFYSFCRGHFPLFRHLFPQVCNPFFQRLSYLIVPHLRFQSVFRLIPFILLPVQFSYPFLLFRIFPHKIIYFRLQFGFNRSFVSRALQLWRNRTSVRRKPIQNLIHIISVGLYRRDYPLQIDDFLIKPPDLIFSLTYHILVWFFKIITQFCFFLAYFPLYSFSLPFSCFIRLYPGLQFPLFFQQLLHAILNLFC